MNVKPQVCPKCQGEMVQGFVADYAHGNAILVGSWVEGPPVKSFLGGIKLRSLFWAPRSESKYPLAHSVVPSAVIWSPTLRPNSGERDPCQTELSPSIVLPS